MFAHWTFSSQTKTFNASYSKKLTDAEAKQYYEDYPNIVNSYYFSSYDYTLQYTCVVKKTKTNMLYVWSTDTIQKTEQLYRSLK